MTCGARIQRGYREGMRCGNHATAIVVGERLLVCGIHARAYLPRGLARIAYWDRRSRSWP